MCCRQDVINWISRAWEAVTNEVIIRSFKATGITNNLDGSEDELLTENMAAALNAHDRDAAREEAAGLLFDDDDDGDGLRI